MKIKTLLVVSLILALMAGHVKAQNKVQYSRSTRAQLPIELGFENGEMGEWQFINEDPEGGEFYGEAVEDVFHNGEWSFTFQSHDNYEDYLISPELDDTENGIVFHFWFTNYYLGCSSSFKVGYSTFSNDIDDFVWGEMKYATKGTITWNDEEEEIGEAGWDELVCNYPEGVKYVAIAFPPEQTSGVLFVDDLSIETAPCAMPSMIQVTGITDESISLSWQGNNESYDVQYAPFQAYYDFETGSLDPWTSIIDGQGERGWVCSQVYGSHCAKSDYGEEDTDTHYLVSPKVALGGSLSFYAREESSFKSTLGKSSLGGTHFEVKVLVSSKEQIDASDISGAVSVSGEQAVISMGWIKYSFDLTYEGFVGGDGFVIIEHINDVNEPDIEEIFPTYPLLIDDITLMDSWVGASSTETNYEIVGLTPKTTYAIRLRGNGEGDVHSSWTTPLYVTTLPDDPEEMPDSYEFVTDGDWNVPSNWDGGYVPQNIEDLVIVSANAIIPEGCVAKGTITMNGGSITIRDGGQLMHNIPDVGDDIEVTAKKRIWAYPAEGKFGYYLVASPVGAMPEGVDNLLNNDYDLYKFDQTQELEWQNYKKENGTYAENFVLTYPEGFLYANSGNVTLGFHGEIESSEEGFSTSLEYAETEVGLRGWNLVGNPFMCNAYIGRPFYRLTPDSEELVAADANDVIAPMEGVFVQAEDADDAEEGITFSREAQNNSKGSVLNVNVIRNEANVDVARVRFGEGRGLEKFQLNPSHTKIYFPQNGKNYAVVSAGSIDELPFCFKAENDDTFTLSFTQEQVEFSYLHLIDNMTGADIDLLQQPEYTFESKVSDYPSRFRVVFVAKDEDGSLADSEAFAFNSNGNFIIINEGQATLQVIDLQGRMISSETIEGCVSKNLQATTGVYVLRLINGENVRVQKIVVR